MSLVGSNPTPAALRAKIGEVEPNVPTWMARRETALPSRFGAGVASASGLVGGWHWRAVERSMSCWRSPAGHAGLWLVALRFPDAVLSAWAVGRQLVSLDRPARLMTAWALRFGDPGLG